MRSAEALNSRQIRDAFSRLVFGIRVGHLCLVLWEQEPHNVWQRINRLAPNKRVMTQRSGGCRAATHWCRSAIGSRLGVKNSRKTQHGPAQTFHWLWAGQINHLKLRSTKHDHFVFFTKQEGKSISFQYGLLFYLYSLIRIRSGPRIGLRFKPSHLDILSVSFETLLYSRYHT